MLDSCLVSLDSSFHTARQRSKENRAPSSLQQGLIPQEKNKIYIGSSLQKTPLLLDSKASNHSLSRKTKNLRDYLSHIPILSSNVQQPEIIGRSGRESSKERIPSGVRDLFRQQINIFGGDY
ncbi:hypothetical protein FGO68_gene7812 [Halteria grandinella]|uniref:Uncharacterized protein n=1 Tax=Halteria grandinella TaxID=5974 RepID=A0A8J8T0I9_HALGN|nr:hypothetical protein FGO68_gene7812 [Halteria grandinella]